MFVVCNRNLSTGQERILSRIKDRKLAVQIQNRVNDIEIQSKLYPSMKDWLKETYIACGRGFNTKLQ